jgi:ADP-ribose pyrophosphatase
VADRPEAWPVVSTEDVLRGGAPFAVRRDVVRVPGGDETMTRVVVEHPGAVVVLAVDDQERALVLQQYRHPARTRFVELPAGLLDKEGEDPLVAARRELLEEGALEAEEWTHLNTVHSSPGFSDERIEVYLARGLRSVPDRGGFVLEHEEADMTLHWVPVAELLEAALARRWTDGPGLIALLTYAVTHGTALPADGAPGA